MFKFIKNHFRRFPMAPWPCPLSGATCSHQPMYPSVDVSGITGAICGTPTAAEAAFVTARRWIWSGSRAAESGWMISEMGSFFKDEMATDLCSFVVRSVIFLFFFCMLTVAVLNPWSNGNWLRRTLKLLETKKGNERNMRANHDVQSRILLMIFIAC